MVSKIELYEKKLVDNKVLAREKMFTALTLIELKKKSNTGGTEELYWLTKELIKYYIQCVSNRKFIGYDTISVNRLMRFVSEFENDKKLALLKFTSRELKALQYEDESILIDSQINKYEFIVTWEKHKIKKPFKLLFHLTTMSFTSTIISLSIIPILALLLFYPFSFQVIHVFDISYNDISDNQILNHISNCFMLFTGMDGIRVEPTGLFGTVLLLIGKVLFFVVVFNFLLEKLTTYLTR